MKRNSDMEKTKSREQIFVKVYVSADEKAAICAAAAFSGLSLSEYARSKIVGPRRRAGNRPGPAPRRTAENEENAAVADGKKDAGSRRTRMVHVYLSPGEQRYVAGTAAQLKLPVSGFIRRLAMHMPLPSPADFAARDAVRDLMKVNADLARLGNSLRQMMDILGASAVSREWLEATAELEREIRARQEQMKALGVEISEAVRTGAHIRR